MSCLIEKWAFMITYSSHLAYLAKAASSNEPEAIASEMQLQDSPEKVVRLCDKPCYDDIALEATSSPLSVFGFGLRAVEGIAITSRAA